MTITRSMPPAKNGAVTLTVVADAADVRLFNRFFDEKLTRSIRERGLLVPIGQPVNGDTGVETPVLTPHEASFSEAGVAWLKDQCLCNPDARRLGLTPGETFGLMLAFWRSLYPVGMPGVKDKDYGRAVGRFGAYKAAEAQADGRDNDAACVIAAARDIQRAHAAKRRDEGALNRSISRALGHRIQ